MGSLRITLDSVDLKVLHGAFLAISDSIRLLTAYSFEGMESVRSELQRVRWKNGSLTTEDVVAVLRNHVNFLKLEGNHELPELAKSVEQVLRHALDIGSLGEEICRRDSSVLFQIACISTHNY